MNSIPRSCFNCINIKKTVKTGKNYKRLTSHPSALPICNSFYCNKQKIFLYIKETEAINKNHVTFYESTTKNFDWFVDCKFFDENNKI